MVKLRRFTLAVVTVCGASCAWATGDYVFLNPAYLAQTRVLITEARDKAPVIFKTDAGSVQKLNEFASLLDDQITGKQRELAFKKVTTNSVTQDKDAAFGKALNDFKDALNFMAEIAHQPLGEILPSYNRWNQLETAVVKQGLDQRLAAYQMRFGPDSEPNNILEFALGQKFLPGNEAGPASWEPILRVEAVQATSRGSGLTSSLQVGLNHYFVQGVPKMLSWVGLSNHVGLAAMVQYLDHPGILEVRGRPSFGLMVHMDRKEVGVSWDNAEDRLNLTIGYAFQFIPMVM